MHPHVVEFHGRCSGKLPEPARKCIDLRQREAIESKSVSGRVTHDPLSKDSARECDLESLRLAARI